MSKEKNPTQEYLLQVKLCDAHINNKLEELAQLKALATKVTSTLKQDAVSGGTFGDKVGDVVSRIVDMQNEINAAIDEYVDKKKEVKRIIEQVTNPDQLNVLLKCYILHESLEQIACEMGYSYRNICYIHGRALQAVAAVMEGEKHG
jgi:DNA-directed RNA polymerase specialized sigma subunit